MLQNHMTMLEGSVTRHPDFISVFGDEAAGGRFSCAEVPRPPPACEIVQLARVCAASPARLVRVSHVFLLRFAPR